MKIARTYNNSPNLKSDESLTEYFYGKGKKMRRVISRKKLCMEKGYLVPGPVEKGFIDEAKKKKKLVNSGPSRRWK